MKPRFTLLVVLMYCGILAPGSAQEPVQVLSNGVAVQVQGVTFHPSKGQTWWDIGGAALTASPHENDEALLSVYPLTREVSVCITNLPAESHGLAWRTTPEAAATRTTSVNQTGEQDCRVVAFGFREDLDAVELQAGVATPPWTPRLVYKGIVAAGVQSDDGRIAIGDVSQKPESLRVIVTDTLLDEHLRLTFIDKKGKIREPSAAEGFITGHTRRNAFDFEALELDDLRSLQVSSAPYAWAVFPSVAMAPADDRIVDVNKKPVVEAEAAGEPAGIHIHVTGQDTADAADADAALLTYEIMGVTEPLAEDWAGPEPAAAGAFTVESVEDLVDVISLRLSNVPELPVVLEGGDNVALEVLASLAAALRDAGALDVSVRETKDTQAEIELDVSGFATLAMDEKLRAAGILLRRYAEAHEGMFPPRADTPGAFYPAPDSLYPEITDDKEVMAFLRSEGGEPVVYTGFALATDVQGDAFLDLYESQGPEAVLAEDAPLSNETRLFRLHDKAEPLVLPGAPGTGETPARLSDLPIMWSMPNAKIGGWILFLDGHVEWRGFPSGFPYTAAFTQRVNDLMAK